MPEADSKKTTNHSFYKKYNDKQGQVEQNISVAGIGSNKVEKILNKPGEIGGVATMNSKDKSKTVGLLSQKEMEERVKTVGAYRMLGAGSSGVLLEVPTYFPIYDDDQNNPVPFSIKLNSAAPKTLQFNFPSSGERSYTIVGWYAILCVRVQEEQGGPFRLYYLSPDSQNQIINLAGTQTLQRGWQAGQLLTIGWQFQDFILGGWHLGNQWYNLRTFPIPLMLPAGAQGQVTIQRQYNTKWTEFFPETDLYLYAGLICRRELKIPPPFNVDSSMEPTRIVSNMIDNFEVDNLTNIGNFPSNVYSQMLKLKNRHPTLLSELMMLGETDGIYFKLDWLNGSLSSDWLPAVLFKYRMAGGILPCPIFLPGQSQLNFQFAEGIRNQTVEDLKARIAVDFAGGEYGIS